MSEFTGTTGWSAKREILQAHAHPDMAFNQAIVVGDADSNEIVALAFGYSPEGCAKRARLIAAAPALLEALQRIAEATPSSTNSQTVEQFRSWTQAVAAEAISLACGEQADAG